MTVSDLVTFASELGAETRDFVTGYVAKAMAALDERLREVDQRLAQLKELGGMPGPPGRPGDPGPEGKPGRDIDPQLFQAELAKALASQTVTFTALIRDEVAKAVALLPVPKDGRDGRSIDPAVVDIMVAAQVDRAMKTIPIPKDGAPGPRGEKGEPGDPGEVGPMGPAGPQGDRGESGLTGPVGPSGPSGPQGEKGIDGINGRDGAPGERGEMGPIGPQGLMGPMGPQGEKGLDGLRGEIGPAGPRGEKGLDGLRGEVGPMGPRGEKGLDGAPGRDGVGLASTFVDRAGHLIVTLSDGGTKDVGPVVGKNVDLDDVVRLVESELAKWPRPKDGADGKDGLGFDDLEFEHDAGGRLFLKLSRGEMVKTVRVPCITDQKVWRYGVDYLKGDAVTHNRSIFIAQRDHPTGKPEDASGDWRLAVTRGKDGRDGRDAIKPEPED